MIAGWPRHQSERINPSQRVPCDVNKQINPTFQPSWIRGDVSTCSGVIIPEVIAVQPGFLIIILARKAEGILNCLNRRYCSAKGSVGSFPDNCLAIVCQNLWCAQMVIMKIINHLSRSNHRQELVSKINVFTHHLAALLCLCDQMAFKVIMKDSGAGLGDFHHPLANPVVNVASDPISILQCLM